MMIAVSLAKALTPKIFKEHVCKVGLVDVYNVERHLLTVIGHFKIFYFIVQII